MRGIARLMLLLVATTAPTLTRAADPPAAAKAPPMPQSFVATGPSGDADLARLREALAKIGGVTKVEAHAAPGGVTLLVEGEFPGTLLVAAARSVGFIMRPMPMRSYTVSGPTGDADLARLRAALGQVPGIEKIDLGRHETGAALRVKGAAPPAALLAAGKSAGFTLRQLASYVASGPSAEADLKRLRTALGKVAGVEQVEAQRLTGGATLLIYGDVNDDLLAAGAKTAGYALWPLSNGVAPREFRLIGSASTADYPKLQEALRSVEGMGEVALRTATEGTRLVVTGGRVAAQRIIAEATKAGFTLIPMESVPLPSLAPTAERDASGDYEDRILEDQVKPGEPAPQFTLLAKDGKEKISLSDYFGKKPVVLLFGSCT